MLSLRPPVWCVLACIWLLMIFFTALTPWAYDDYSFALRAPQWQDVIPAAIDSYFTWNGRIIAETLGGFLVLAPPPVYILGTATAFTGLLVCMVVVALGATWQQRVTRWHLVLLFALVWSSVPAFGCAFLWRVGTVNFLWTSLAVFASFIPFRLLLERSTDAPLRLWHAVLLGLLCFCAGLSNENLGILSLFFAAGVLVVKRLNKTRFSRKYYAVAACIPAGFLCLILAPGNYVRLNIEVAKLPAAVTASFWAKIPYWVEKMLMGYGGIAVTLVVFVVLLYYCRKRVAYFSTPQRCVLGLAGVFCLFAMMASGALFFSPSYPLRAFTGISLLYVQATVCAFVAVQTWLPHKKILAIVMCVALACSVLYQGHVFWVNNAVNQQRLQIYSQSKGLDALVPPFQNVNKFFFIGWHIKDLQNSTEVNSLIARYYGLRSVKTP